MRRWWQAERGWETTEAEVDLRVGGAVRVVMRDPRDGRRVRRRRPLHGDRPAEPPGVHLDLGRRHAADADRDRLRGDRRRHHRPLHPQRPVGRGGGARPRGRLEQDLRQPGARSRAGVAVYHRGVTTGGDASSYDVLEYPPGRSCRPIRIGWRRSRRCSGCPPRRPRAAACSSSAAASGATCCRWRPRCPARRSSGSTTRPSRSPVRVSSPSGWAWATCPSTPSGSRSTSRPRSRSTTSSRTASTPGCPSRSATALLALCARVLSPDGVAYVSYNALPGGHLRQMLRGCARPPGLGGVEEPRERVAAARRFLALLVEAGEADDELVPTLGRAAREVIDRDDAFLFHDVLADDNQPFYLHEFVASAKAHGLAYLSEAQFSEMQVDVLPPSLQPVLAGDRRSGAPRRAARRPQGAQVPPDAPVPCGPPARSRAEARAAGRDGGVGSAALDGGRGERSRHLPRARHRPRRVRPPARRAHAAGDRRELAVAGPIAELGEERELPAIHDILLRCYATNLVRLHVDPPTGQHDAARAPARSARSHASKRPRARW